MKAVFRHVSSSESLSATESRFAFPNNYRFVEGASYEVHAVSVFNGIVFLLVVDEDNLPIFRPRVLFEVIDQTIPQDWVCGVFNGDPQLVAGPPFIASSMDAYESMIDRCRATVDRFHDRAEAIASSDRAERDV